MLPRKEPETLETPILLRYLMGTLCMRNLLRAALTTISTGQP